jgi:copper chaperone CopZ
MCYNNIKKCVKALEGLDASSEKAKALAKYISSFTGIHNVLQDSDWAPTTQMINAAKETEIAFNKFYVSL